MKDDEETRKTHTSKLWQTGRKLNLKKLREMVIRQRTQPYETNRNKYFISPTTRSYHTASTSLFALEEKNKTWKIPLFSEKMEGNMGNQQKLKEIAWDEIILSQGDELSAYRSRTVNNCSASFNHSGGSVLYPSGNSAITCSSSPSGSFRILFLIIPHSL